MRSWDKQVYNKSLSHAKARGIEFTLTRDEFADLVSYSEGRCALTGIEFDHTTKAGQKVRPFAPSLDRIDSKKGYVQGNVRLVCIAINLAMNEWGETVFKRLAAAYVGEGDPYAAAWRKKRRGYKMLPGVTQAFTKSGQVRYRTECRCKGSYKYIGTFDTELEAHQAFEKTKAEMAQSI